MITLRTRTGIASVALAISCASVVDAEELARIPPHSQRYGAHIGISAYDDPLLNGVTCFVSEPHTRDERPSSRDRHGAGASVSCHQTGTLATPPACRGWLRCSTYPSIRCLDRYTWSGLSISGVSSSSTSRTWKATWRAISRGMWMSSACRCTGVERTHPPNDATS